MDLAVYISYLKMKKGSPHGVMANKLDCDIIVSLNSNQVITFVSLWNVPQKPGKESGGIGDQRKKCDYLDHRTSIIS